MSSKIDLETYIDNIEYSSDRVKDIITVEHRLNNKKRDFLFATGRLERIIWTGTYSLSK